MTSLNTLLINRVTLRQRAFMIKQLSLLLSSGVPLASALNLAAQQTDNRVIHEALRSINRAVESGHSLSSAAAGYPQIFDPVMVSIIKSGEASGRLQEVLTELAGQMERDSNFTNKLRNALLYPAFVVFVMIIVGIIMTTIIIPRLTSVFEDTAVTLPWSTKLLIIMSNILMNYWYVIIVIMIGVYYGLRSYFATPAGKAQYYNLQMRIPGVRTLIEGAYLVRFTRILAMLTRSGVPITDAMRLVAESLSNKLYVKAINTARSEVERGIPLSTALSRHQVFPKPLVQMIAVGEQTGKLDEALDNMSRVYEEQTTIAIGTVTSLIEPTILVVVALAAGFVVLAVILPIYGLAEQF